MIKFRLTLLDVENIKEWLDANEYEYKFTHSRIYTDPNSVILYLYSAEAEVATRLKWGFE